MSNTTRIQDLNATEIAELLANDGSELTPDQAAAIHSFVDDIGGFENAMAAIELLGQLEEAA